MNHLQVGASGWSVFMQIYSNFNWNYFCITRRRNFWLSYRCEFYSEKFEFSGGGTYIGAIGRDTITATSTKGGTTEVSFDFRDDNAVDFLRYRTQHSRDFITIKNFNSEDRIQLDYIRAV